MRLGAALAALVLVLALGVLLAGRFWFGDRLDEWRPQIAARLSQQSGADVAMDHLSLRWHGLLPRVILTGLRIRDARGRVDLSLEQVSARPGLLGLLRGRLEFAELLIDQPSLQVVRRADGRFLVAGILLPGPTDEPGSPFVDWLLAQRDIHILNGHLHWQDLQAGTLPLDLPNVQLRLQGTGQHHLIDLSADAPANLMRGLVVHVDLQAGDSQHAASWKGRARARADFVDIAALRTYLDTPAALRSGRGSFSTEVQFTGLQLDALESDTRLEGVALTLAADLPELRFDRLSGHVGYVGRPGGFALRARQLLALSPGTPEQAVPRPADVDVDVSPAGGHASASVVNLGALAGLTESLPLPRSFRDAVRSRAPEGMVQDLSASWTGSLPDLTDYRVQARVDDLSLRAAQAQPGVQHLSGQLQADRRGGSLSVDSRALTLDLPGVFGQSLSLAGVTAAAHWQQNGTGTLVTIDRLHLDDPELAGHFAGSIELQHGLARATHLTGQLDRAVLTAVPRFLPLLVGSEARQWLQTALRAGTARQVTLELAGDLQAFPFARPGSGVFRVHVPVEDVRMDYAPGWPALTALRGTLDFDGAALRFRAEEARQDRLQVRDTEGSIPDLFADKPVLTVHGAASGPLQAGLQFILDSPLHTTLGDFAGSVRAEGEGTLTLALRVPLAHAEDTTVNGTVTIERGELQDPAGVVPLVTHIATRLQFTERDVHADLITARVLGGAAQAALRTATTGDVLLDVQGAVDMADAAAFYGDGKLAFLRGQGDWSGNFRFAGAGVDIDVRGHLPVLGYPADLLVHQKGHGAMTVQVSSRMPLAGVLRQVAPDVAGLGSGDLDWKFVLHREHGVDDISGGGQFTLAGHPGTVTLSGRPGALQADLSGQADVRALAALLPAPWSGVFDGIAPWSARYDERPGQPLVRLQGDLRLVRVALPAPVGKSVGQASALRLQVRRMRSGNIVMSGGVDSFLGVALQLPSNSGEPLRRLALRVGGAANVPTMDGLELSGDLAVCDVDAWQEALRAPVSHPGAQAGLHAAPHAAAAPSAGSTAPADEVPGLPLRADLHVHQLLAAGYRFEDVQAQARSDLDGWHLQLHGSPLEGTLDWRPASGGSVRAQLARAWLAAVENGTPGKVTPLAAHDRLPALDLDVQDLRVDGHALGHLELKGEVESAGWHLSRVALTHSQGSVVGEGHWFSAAAHNRTHINLDVAAEDTGAWLKALGYPQALARARSRVHVGLDWPGDPQDFQVGRLSGTLDLDARNGQFLTLEPGVGRLLGLLSLQALPRRVTLDFRDIFSQGFAFDAVTGHFDIEQGILRTQNLQMAGPAARVFLRGQTSLVQETQDLSVRVSPAVGNGVAVASTVIGGPVAGAAAYALQKLLQDPIDKILTFEYHVTGTWDDPQVTPLRREPAPVDKSGVTPAGALGRSRLPPLAQAGVP